MLERGQGLYSVGCASCHGSEARGGETGSNLLRSPVILDDQNGELLLPIVRAGRPERGMPPRPDLTEGQVRDIATYIGHGYLTTAGRLLFGGDPGGNLVAYDPANGRPLWHVRLGEVSSSPQTYMLDGRQYILVAAVDMLYAFALPQ